MSDQEFATQLAAYLQTKIPDAQNLQVRNILQIPGGASKLTYSVDAVWDGPEGQKSWGLIVRKNQPAGPTDTTPDVEYRIYEILGNKTSIPVPKVLWLEEDHKWLGQPFFVMERIEGVISSNDQQTLLTQYRHIHEKLGQQVAHILADTHNLDWQSLGMSFLGEAPAPDKAALHEVEHWEGVMHREQLEPQPELEAAFCWMKRHLPPPAQRITIVHGDYRVGNFLYNDSGIIAFLDWELAHLGDPIEDVAWACMMSFPRLGRTDRLPGLVSRDQFLRWYQERSGITVDPEALLFWEVFANVRTAIILLQGGWRFCKGLNKDIFQAWIGRVSLNIQLEALRLMGLT